jgi:hypothetical protein
LHVGVVDSELWKGGGMEFQDTGGELALFGFDAEPADHLCPLVGRFDGELAELGRRHQHWDAAQVRDPLLDRRIGEAGIDFAVEPVDNFGGRIFWRTSAEKSARLVAGHGFADGRNVWQRS